MSHELQLRLNRYVGDLFAEEDETLRFVRQQTEAHGLPLINLAPNEARLLQLLVMLSGARRVIEIGTLAGYSGIWIARALPPNGSLTTIEKSSLRASLARSHFERAGLADKVTVLQGDGSQALQKLAADAPYDLMFIDADKVSYPSYLEWAAANLRVGGALVADNAFWQGNIFNPSTADDHGMAAFNRALAGHAQFESTIIAVGDGMALAVKKS